MQKFENIDLTPTIGNTVLPAVFSSVDEAVKLLKLDRRHKWEEWNVYKSPALASGNLGTIKIEEI